MNPTKLKLAVPAGLAIAALAMSACGDDETTTEAEQTPSPETAVAQIGETQKGLNEALATYSKGDEAGAADQVTETYLQHFELVEGPLEEVDEELNEELEDAIREELVGAMEAGDPVKDVTALVKQIDSDLADATKALQGS